MSTPAVLTVETLLDRAAISDVVHRYPTGIDRRQWDALRSCFIDEIVDYDFRSWRGGEVRRILADDWVTGVKGTLSGFDSTQHISSNHVHTINGDDATCVSYMIANHHAVENGERMMHSIGGYYTNKLRRTPKGWKIYSCTLTVTWEMGDRAKLFGIATRRVEERVAKAG